MTPESQALQTYHARYNNITYQAAQAAIVTDLHGPVVASQPMTLDEALASEPAHALMNLFIDVALEFVGHPLMRGRCDRLAAAVLHAGLSADTVRLMATHLAHFDRAASADFADRTLALMVLRDHDLADLVSQSAGLRGISGVIVNNLVSAAHALLTLARLVLLNEPSETYKREKLLAAERSLAHAKDWLSQLNDNGAR